VTIASVLERRQAEMKKMIRRIEFGGRGWSGNQVVEGLVDMDDISTVTRVMDPPRGIPEMDGCVKVVMKSGEEFLAKGKVSDFEG